jgi:hypothetical protein
MIALDTNILVYAHREDSAGTLIFPAIAVVILVLRRVRRKHSADNPTASPSRTA